MSNKKEEDYQRIKKYLVEHWEMGKRLESNPVMLHSGDNSVLMRGEFGGYSLRALIQFVAEYEGKTIQYEQDEY